MVVPQVNIRENEIFELLPELLNTLQSIWLPGYDETAFKGVINRLES